MEKKLDKISVPQNCLDVLAQQIYGMAIANKMHIDVLFQIIKQSYCYRNLSRSDFLQLIDYLAGKYSSLEVRLVYAKIWFDEQTGMIGRRGKTARLIYMTNIGTIPEEARVVVKIKEHKIGTIDESFLERLKKGDVFVLGGETYEFKYAMGMVAQVAVAIKRPPTVPSWFSEMLPLSFDLAIDIQKFRKLLEEKFAVRKSRKEIIDFIHSYLFVEENAAQAIFEYFKQQFEFAEIPHNSKLIVELYKEGDKRHLIFHALFGRRTNDALSRAIGYLLGRLIHKDVEISINDNGFMIASNAKLPIERALSLLKSKDLRTVLEQAIDKSEVLGRRFRHCATRSLMILRSYKGREKTVGRQQMSSRLLLSAVKRINENFPILKEARREVLEDMMDIKSAEKVVQGIEQGLIKIKRVDTSYPSPFGQSLYIQGYAELLRIEERLAFLRRMHEEIQKRITGQALAKETAENILFVSRTMGEGTGEN
jgi:ATP-dependent Lhr-like helicase